MTTEQARNLLPMEQEILRRIMALGRVVLDASKEPDRVVRADQLAVILRSEPFARQPQSFAQAMASSSVPLITPDMAANMRKTDLPGHFTELSLTGVRIKGRLDLDHGGRLGAPLPHMRFSKCVFTDSIDFSSSLMGGVCFEDCQLEGELLLADGTRFGDKFTLRNCHLRDGVRIILNKCRMDNTCEIATLIPDLHPDPQGDLFASRNGHSTEATAYNEKMLGALQMNDSVVRGDLLLEGLEIKSDPSPEKPGKDTECALDLRGVHVLGSIRIRSDGTSTMQIVGGADLYCATVEGDVEIKGVKFSGHGAAPGLRLDGANVSGTVEIGKIGQIRSRIIGKLSLKGLHTGEQLQLKYLTIGQDPPVEDNTPLALKRAIALFRDPKRKSHNLKDEAAEVAFHAISLDGAVIGSDLYIIECDVVGTVRLPGCQVTGQLGLVGSTLRSVSTWQRVVEARDMEAKGGIFLIPHGKRPLKTQGQMDFRRV